jgi:CheY-like chemotaxis protein/HPt (histidine-containing phosphotransfer) domain-containing protein
MYRYVFAGCLAIILLCAVILVIYRKLSGRAERKKAALETEKLKKQLEQANQEKSKLLSDVSHEIRTPMNIILGLAQIILRDQTLGEETRDNVKSIQKEGKNLISTLDHILDFSQTKSGEENFQTKSDEENSQTKSGEKNFQTKSDEENSQIKPGKENSQTKSGKENFQTESGKEKSATSAEQIRHRGNADVRNHSQTVGSTGNEETLMERFTAPEAKLLAVDDNVVNLKVLVSLLKPYKMQIDTASGGMECLELLKKKTYDLILLDHMMPEMDGIETLHLIRKMEKEQGKQEVPVIAFTANAVSGSREMFLQEGFQDYVAKPVELEFLEKVLKEQLPKHLLQPEELREVQKAEKRAEQRKVQGAEQRKVQGAEQKTEQRKIQKSEKRAEQREIQKEEQGTGQKVQRAGQKEEQRTEQLEQEQKASESTPVFSVPVDGIDYERGLSLFAGDKEQYLEIIKSVMEEGRRISIEMSEALAAEDYKNYTIKIHALKGMTANIGADGFAKKAKALEMAGKEGNYEYIRRFHEETLDEFEVLAEGMDRLILAEEKEEEEDGTELPEISKEALSEKIKEAKKYLEDYYRDEAMDILQECFSFRLPDGIKAELREMKDMVCQFQYQEPVEKANEILHLLENFPDS